MENDFQLWLTKMYYENCKEREEDGVTPFKSVDAYYRNHPKWLREKFNESKREK